MAHPEGNTISQLNLAIKDLDRNKPAAFAAALRTELVKLKDDRLNWYLGQMRSRSRLVNRLPAISAGLGVVGLLFSAFAVVARALNLAQISSSTTLDVVMMSIAVVAYALMSAGLLFERLIEGSGGYFRAATTMVAIRDLWSQYQFADIGRALAPVDPNPDPDNEIKRWLEPAQAFCKSLDAIVTAELTQWQTAYLATAKMRSEVADEGLKSAIAALKLSADEAAKSAKEAASKADEAVKAVAAAQSPAALNLTLGLAGVAGEATIKVDGDEKARATGQASFSIPLLKQGLHAIRVDFKPADANKPATSFEKIFDLKSGLNAETIPLY